MSKRNRNKRSHSKRTFKAHTRTYRNPEQLMQRYLAYGIHPPFDLVQQAHACMLKRVNRYQETGDIAHILPSTEPGKYTMPLWKEEAKILQELDIGVEIKRGFEWQAN